LYNALLLFAITNRFGNALIFSLPLLNPPPPKGRGRIGKIPSVILPLPLGGGGYRWGRNFKLYTSPLLEVLLTLFLTTKANSCRRRRTMLSYF